MIRRLFRDSNDRMYITHNKKRYEIIGDIDCEYRATQLLKVKSLKWSGKRPKPPFQFLGILDNDDINEIVKTTGDWFGSDIKMKEDYI